jgi:triacylglycerol lipase
MSFLVELAESAYPKRALDRLALNEEFNHNNELSMMWMSQLAYETADEKKVERILTSWNMHKRDFESNDPITGLPPHSACVVIAGGLGATIVAFAGTDPLKIEDWITDFTPALSTTNLHSGFEQAVDTVWPNIKSAIENRPADERALFFTGHSLGGALALIAARRAARDLQNSGATAVYTFGGPRVGGLAFFDEYMPRLGSRTFRFVHGGDIVPTVPPKIGGFRHVGDCIQCPTDGRFDGPRTEMTTAVADKPDFLESTLAAGLADFRAMAAFRFLRRIGPRPLDRAAALLPRMVRDHLPSNYFRALGVKL